MESADVGSWSRRSLTTTAPSRWPHTTDHGGISFFFTLSKLFSIAAGCDILQNKAQCIELHHIHDSNTNCCSVSFGHANARRQGGVGQGDD
ncbi:hypothetical protein E2C01_057545 [Portunus trituberculatus]|uniref:Uncharacterized protein n=1 Tax=Portunus trituberculatus TaxID=210409 RepID=A0A5B7H274_PORTR|nr:hypothetical protein [Portunus trituberculatus]